MKKYFIMVNQYYKKNKLLSLIVVFELIFATVLFSTVLTRFQYYYYSQSVFSDFGMSNFDYYTPHTALFSQNPYEDIKKDIEIVEGTEGVEKVIAAQTVRCYERDDFSTENFSDYYYLSMQDTDFLKSADVDIAKGHWFEEENDNNYIEAVVTGERLATSYSSDEIIKLVVVPEGGIKAVKEIEIKIIGVIASPGYIPDFGSGGTYMTTQQLLSSSDNFIIICDNDKNKEMLDGCESYFKTSLNFYIKYEKGISEEDRSDIREQLSASGILSTHETIQKNSEEYTKEQVKEVLPTTLFLLIIATFGLISSVTITIYKLSSDFSVYYICGCSPSKCFMYSGTAIFIMGFLGTIVSIVRLGYIRYIRNTDIRYYASGSDSSIINSDTYLILGLYIFVTLLLAIVTAYGVFKKNSPIKAYNTLKK